MFFPAILNLNNIAAAVGDCILSFDILGCVNDVLAVSYKKKCGFFFFLADFTGPYFFIKCLLCFIFYGLKDDVLAESSLLFTFKPWYLYYMVTQEMLRTHEGKKVFRRK